MVDLCRVSFAQKRPEARLLVLLIGKPPRPCMWSRSGSQFGHRIFDGDDDYQYLDDQVFNQVSDFIWCLPIGKYKYGLRASCLQSAVATYGSASLVLTPDCHDLLKERVKRLGMQYLAIHLLSPIDDERILRMYQRGDSAMRIAGKLPDRQSYDRRASMVDGIYFVPPMLRDATLQYVEWLIDRHIRAPV